MKSIFGSAQNKKQDNQSHGAGNGSYPDLAMKTGTSFGTSQQMSMADVVPGKTAHDKIKQLASGLYQQTPVLEKELPQSQIQIFQQQYVQPDKRSQLLAGASSQYSASQQDILRDLKKKEAQIRQKTFEYGAGGDDDQAQIMKQYKQWEESKQHSKDLKNQLISKQEYYIRREQEYRKTIDDIHNEIAKRSSDPFGFLQQSVASANQNMGDTRNNMNSQASKIGAAMLSIVKEDLDPHNEDDSPTNNGGVNQSSIDKENYLRRKNIYMNNKNANSILDYYDKIMRTIEKVQRTTASALETQRNEICEVLDNRLEEIKRQIKDEKAKKGDSGADFKEREKELNDHLETMTQIAQKIDFENRELMKKNVDLNIQVKSQEQDRDILLQQLLYEKKEGKKLQQKLKGLREKADVLERQQLEEQAEINQKNINHQQSQQQLQTIESQTPNTKDDYYNIKPQSSSSITQNTINLGLNRVASNQNIRASNLKQNETPLIMNARANNNHMQSTMLQKSQQLQGLLPSIMSNATNMGSRQGSRLLQTAGKEQLLLQQNPKIQRYEQLIEQLKKMLDSEKKSNFQIKTIYSKEMEVKKELEKVLRQSIEDVREEINRKRNETQNIYKQSKRLIGGQHDSNQDQISIQERERIIDVLMSQERVLTLLYDKTFPPRKDIRNAQLAILAQSQQFTSSKQQISSPFSSTQNIDDNILIRESMDDGSQFQSSMPLAKNSSMPSLLLMNSGANKIMQESQMISNNRLLMTKTSTLSNILNRNTSHKVIGQQQAQPQSRYKYL